MLLTAADPPDARRATQAMSPVVAAQPVKSAMKLQMEAEARERQERAERVAAKQGASSTPSMRAAANVVPESKLAASAMPPSPAAVHATSTAPDRSTSGFTGLVISPSTPPARRIIAAGFW